MADTIERMPIGRRLALCATLWDMQVMVAPVSSSAGNVLIVERADPDEGVTPVGITPTLIRGPMLGTNLPLRQGM